MSHPNISTHDSRNLFLDGTMLTSNWIVHALTGSLITTSIQTGLEIRGLVCWHHVSLYQQCQHCFYHRNRETRTGATYKTKLISTFECISHTSVHPDCAINGTTRISRLQTRRTDGWIHIRVLDRWYLSVPVRLRKASRRRLNEVDGYTVNTFGAEGLTVFEGLGFFTTAEVGTVCGWVKLVFVLKRYLGIGV